MTANNQTESAQMELAETVRITIRCDCGAYLVNLAAQTQEKILEWCKEHEPHTPRSDPDQTERIAAKAETLTEQLFTGGNGEKSTNLMHACDGNVSGYGWGAGPFRDHVQNAMNELVAAETESLYRALRHIRDMPAYDQDDPYRLRGLARAALEGRLDADGFIDSRKGER